MKIFGKIILGLFLLILSLNVNGQSHYVDSTFITMCENESFSNDRFDRVTVDSMIVVRDSVTNHAIRGIDKLLICTIMPDGTDIDSVFYLIVTFKPVYNFTIYDTICRGEVYSDYGFNETEAGTYTRNLQTYLGCDSVYVLNLTVGELYNDTIYSSICNGETYSEYGFNQDSAGVYTQFFQSIYGCDSLVTLSLNVHPTYYDTIYDTICKGDIYEEGFNADSSGTYIQNLNTQFGCDSILVLHLQVNPTFTDTIKGNIYKGNVYNKFGFNEKETGVYEQKLQTYLGCDSIIYLDLQVDYIMFPNVVTPNGDGVNDIFDIHNLVEQNAFPENELIIFSRQGKQIYSVKNIKSKGDFWDPQKANSSDGTYFYRFFGKRHDKVLEFYGSIEVMR